jgi:PTH1 family peptidyl-tRNA hydrolase
VAVAQFFSQVFRFFRKHEKPESAQYPFGAEFLVFGIGNAGIKYAETRHNIGFMVVDRCISLGRSIRKNSAAYGAEIATGELSGKKVVFVKPTTFVNQCGPALKSSMETFGVALGSCLVVVDDYNLPLGTMRFRAGGSDGGHNGLKSIVQAVGREFPRLRIGIGPVPEGLNQVDFVLGKFSTRDKAILAPVIDNAARGIEAFVIGGIEKTMSVFNRPRVGNQG